MERELLSKEEMARLGCGWKAALTPWRSIRSRILAATRDDPVMRAQALWTAYRNGSELTQSRASSIQGLDNRALASEEAGRNLLAALEHAGVGADVHGRNP